jgi:hypothetical protein
MIETENKDSGSGITTRADTSSGATTINIPSSDLLHLLQSHLIESGLHATSSTLRSESGGIGLPGLFPSSKGALLQAAKDGRWGEVLQLLDSLDLERCRRNYFDDLTFAKKHHHSHHHREDGSNYNDDDGNNHDAGSRSIVTPLEKAAAMAHEMAILELAEHNELELAYATLRMSSELLDRALSASGDDDVGERQQQKQQQMASNDDTIGIMPSSTRSGDVERRLAALIALRDPTASAISSSSSSSSENNLPSNYYGTSCT